MRGALILIMGCMALMAPHFQSFVEVRVECSANRIRLLPHSPTGPFRWQELQVLGAAMPAGKTSDDFVEFLVPMPERRP